MATEHTIDLHLPERLIRDKEFRKHYFRARSRNDVASQIVALRKRRSMRQADLAKEADMKQSAISRMEQADYEGWNYKTLLRVAEALEARLRVIMEPWEIAISQQADEEASAEGLIIGQSVSERVAQIGEELFGRSESSAVAISGEATVQSFVDFGNRANQYSFQPRS